MTSWMSSWSKARQASTYLMEMHTYGQATNSSTYTPVSVYTFVVEASTTVSRDLMYTEKRGNPKSYRTSHLLEAGFNHTGCQCYLNYPTMLSAPAQMGCMTQDQQETFTHPEQTQQSGRIPHRTFKIGDVYVQAMESCLRQTRLQCSIPVTGSSQL